MRGLLCMPQSSCILINGTSTLKGISMDNNSVPPVQPTQPIPPEEPKKSNKNLIIGLSVGGVLLLAIIGALYSSRSIRQQVAPEFESVNSLRTANQKARDSERQTDITYLRNQLEAYYAINASYPSLADLNNSTWREGNNFNAGDNDSYLQDPQGTEPRLADKPAAKVYAYVATPSGCASASTANGAVRSVGNPCTSFTLTATFEDSSKGQFVKKSLDQE